MPTPRIDELLLMMDCAFEESEHSLLTNLASVSEESWEALPAGGRRPIRQLVHHVGMFKFMYANHGFRGADFDYGKPPATPARERLATIDAAVDWLREGHAYLTGCIRGLADDAELDVPRKAHWGGMVANTAFLIVNYDRTRRVPRRRDKSRSRDCCKTTTAGSFPQSTLCADR